MKSDCTATVLESTQLLSNQTWIGYVLYYFSMAERKLNKTVQASVSQPKKQPIKSSKAQRSRKVEERQPAKSAPRKNQIDDLLSREKEYKLLNAELEAKTVDVLMQAERIMREQTETLSEPLSSLLLEDEDEARVMLQEPAVTAGTKKEVAYASKNTKAGTKSASPVDVPPAVQESVDNFLAETIRDMEKKMEEADDTVEDDECIAAGDDDKSGVSDAQIRVLKAKLRIMQEEMDQLSCDYYKKDEETTKLVAKIKDSEDDRARLQRTVNIQQTQIEKYKALGEESDKKSDILQSQVVELQKQIENLNRSHKQAAGAHSSTEVRLTRAQEEVEKLKSQLREMKQTNKDKIKEEQQSKESILAENKMLKKQKAELIMGFKKQLKLIDILKRQKMHFEAAKLLSFTEDEFMKALDWGKS